MSTYKTDAERALEPLINDPDPQVRLEAIKTLERLAKARKPRKPRPTKAEQVSELVRQQERSGPPAPNAAGHAGVSKGTSVPWREPILKPGVENEPKRPVKPATPVLTPDWLSISKDLDRAALPKPVKPVEEPIPEVFLDRQHAAAWADRCRAAGKPQKIIIGSAKAEPPGYVTAAGKMAWNDPFSVPQPQGQEFVWSQEGGLKHVDSPLDSERKAAKEKARVANLSPSRFMDWFHGRKRNT